MADNDLAGDLLPGTRKIAKFIGKTERQTYHLLEAGRIPAFKIGKIWHGRKSTLRRHFDELEAARVAS
jgi:hypothetical protein